MKTSGKMDEEGYHGKAAIPSTPRTSGPPLGHPTPGYPTSAKVVLYRVLNCINNNTRHLEDAYFPLGGCIVPIGGHRVYIMLIPNEYPSEMLSCDKLPSSDNDELFTDFDDLWTRVELTKLRNSCEGVNEVHVIHYFIDGYSYGTLLKYKLMCREPATLGQLMAIVDKYVMAESSM
ncbi:endoglucanase 3 [Hordeum vulgare]|nr:endoglucanase 3 [Hordeum vulgare]